MSSAEDKNTVSDSGEISKGGKPLRALTRKSGDLKHSDTPTEADFSTLDRKHSILFEAAFHLCDKNKSGNSEFGKLRNSLNWKLLNGQRITTKDIDSSYYNKQEEAQKYLTNYEKAREALDKMKEGTAKEEAQAKFHKLDKPSLLSTLLCNKMDEARKERTTFGLEAIANITGITSIVGGLIALVGVVFSDNLFGFGVGMLQRAGWVSSNTAMNWCASHDCGAGLRLALPDSVIEAGKSDSATLAPGSQGVVTEPVGVSQRKEKSPEAALRSGQQQVDEHRDKLEVGGQEQKNGGWVAKAVTEEEFKKKDCVGHLIKQNNEGVAIESWDVYKNGDDIYYHNAKTDTSSPELPEGCSKKLAAEAIEASSPVIAKYQV